MSLYGPRDKLLEKGASHLTNEELLAVLLRTGNRSLNRTGQGLQVLSLAHCLFSQFPDWRELLCASPEQLKDFSGMGDTKAATLLAVKEIAFRLLKEPLTKKDFSIENCEDAHALFADLAEENQEVLAAAFLTTKNRLIARLEIFRGTLTHSSVSPREILKEALKRNAAKILLAHNHPSGTPNPSPEDCAFTRQMQEASRLLGIVFVDHLILGEAMSYFSFAQTRR
jgi:DNA repair protein RadC